MGKITINADILTNNTEKTCEFSFTGLTMLCSGALAHHVFEIYKAQSTFVIRSKYSYSNSFKELYLHSWNF